jgi:chitodextrinase
MAAGAPYATHGATTGLVAAYSFNEGAGTAVADASGGGNAGIAANTAWTTAGKYGGALTFNGSSSWVTVNDSPSLDLRTAMTIEAWVRPTTLGSTYRTVVIKQQSSNLIYDLYANNHSGRPTGNVFTASDNETQGTAQLPVNTWTFLADTWDGTTLRLYVNGTQVSTLSVSGAMPASTAPLRIGGNSLWNEWFAGQIDEVRVYSRALAASELQADMTTPVSADTVAPSAPTALGQTGATATSVSVSWSASTDNVGVTGYDLFVNGVSAGTSATTSATLTGQPCGTTRTVGVDAHDAAGNRSAISTVAASTSACPDTTPPSVPGGLTQTGSTASSATVAWTASTDNVGVAGYDLYLDGVPAGTTVAWSATFSGLTCGPHTVGVDAYDAAGNRSALATLIVLAGSCPDTSPPTPPSGLAQTAATATSVTVSWTASSDNVGVTGYDLYLDGVPAGTVSASPTTFSGLICGTGHTVGVGAHDAVGNPSSISTVVASTSACPDTVAPSPPTGLAQTGSTATSVAVAWTASTDNVGVTGYDLYLDLVPAGTASGSPATFGGLACGSGHTVGVGAHDAAGNHSAVTTVSVAAAACSTTPTAVPSANAYGVTIGNGFAEASAREVVRTAGNTVYVITADDDTCQGGGSAVIHAWKGVGAQATNANVPAGFVEQDGANRPASSGSADCTYDSSSTLGGPDVRLDAAGVIHLAYIDGRNGNVYYQTFSTSTDKWGSRTVIATGATASDGATWPRYGQVALSLDRNDAPHVAYITSGASNRLQYANRVSGSWSTPVTVASGPSLMHPSMVTSLDGTLHLTWLDDSLATHSDVQYSHYVGGSWSSPEVVSAGDGAVLSNGNSDQGPSIATDSNSVPYVLFMDGTVGGGNDYVRMRYRAVAGWTDDTPPGGSGGASNASATMFAHTPQNYISNTNSNYVFLGHDASVQFGYQYQLGGVGTNWAPFATLDPRSNATPAPGDTAEPGTDGSASVRFDPLRDNNPGIIDVLYFDERDNSDSSHHHATVYYKAIVIGSGTSTPDTTPPVIAMNAPAGGATVSGSVAVAASASDNIGVVGVQFKLDGANLGAEQTAPPYGVTWATASTANGLHTLTAVARDAAGNQTTSAGVAVTVNNVAPPPAQISFVKELGTSVLVDSTGSLALTVPAGGVTAGDTVIVWAAMSGGGGGVTISKITDARGNVYAVDTSLKHPDTGINSFIGSAYVGSALQAGDKITITFSGAYYSLKDMFAAEFRGLSPSGWRDKTALGTGNSASPASTATALTTYGPELVVGGFGSDSTAKFTPGAGFTALTSASVSGSGVTRSIYECYEIVQTSAQYRALGTLSASALWTAATATYH